jgi:hypothetical protein
MSNKLSRGYLIKCILKNESTNRERIRFVNQGIRFY